MPGNEHLSEYDALFRRYVEICNEAMAAHREEFPYKQIWNAAQNAGVRVAVYDDTPKMHYALRLAEDHVEAEQSPDMECPAIRLRLSYLKQVVDRPEEFIENPARLDWGWLKRRERKG